MTEENEGLWLAVGDSIAALMRFVSCNGANEGLVA